MKIFRCEKKTLLNEKRKEKCVRDRKCIWERESLEKFWVVEIHFSFSFQWEKKGKISETIKKTKAVMNWNFDNVKGFKMIQKNGKLNLKFPNLL